MQTVTPVGQLALTFRSLEVTGLIVSLFMQTVTPVGQLALTSGSLEVPGLIPLSILSSKVHSAVPLADHISVLPPGTRSNPSLDTLLRMNHSSPSLIPHRGSTAPDFGFPLTFWCSSLCHYWSNQNRSVPCLHLPLWINVF